MTQPLVSVGHVLFVNIQPHSNAVANDVVRRWQPIWRNQLQLTFALARHGEDIKGTSGSKAADGGAGVASSVDLNRWVRRLCQRVPTSAPAALLMGHLFAGTNRFPSALEKYLEVGRPGMRHP